MEIKEIDQLVKSIASLREQKTNLNSQLKNVEEQLENLNEQFISVLTDLGKTFWEVENIGKMGTSTRCYWTIKNQDKLKAYLEKTNNKDLIKISAQTITGFFNELKEEKSEEDAEFFEKEFGVSFYPKVNVVLRRK